MEAEHGQKERWRWLMLRRPKYADLVTSLIREWNDNVVLRTSSRLLRWEEKDTKQLSIDKLKLFTGWISCQWLETLFYHRYVQGSLTQTMILSPLDRKWGTRVVVRILVKSAKQWKQILDLGKKIGNEKKGTPEIMRKGWTEYGHKDMSETSQRVGNGHFFIVSN